MGLHELKGRSFAKTCFLTFYNHARRPCIPLGQSPEDARALIINITVTSNVHNDFKLKQERVKLLYLVYILGGVSPTIAPTISCNNSHETDTYIQLREINTNY